MSHGGLNRARNWKRWIQPKNTYSSTRSPLLGVRSLSKTSTIAQESWNFTGFSVAPRPSASWIPIAAAKIEQVVGVIMPAQKRRPLPHDAIFHRESPDRHIQQAA